MNWTKAKALIASRVTVGTNLNTPRSTYRKVIAIDADINIDRFGYREERGFVVSIGKDERIKIPWSLLESCFLQLKTSNGYDGEYFRLNHRSQANEHPCHVHVVGQLFVAAGIATLRGRRYISMVEFRNSRKPA